MSTASCMISLLNHQQQWSGNKEPTEYGGGIPINQHSSIAKMLDFH